MTAHDEQSKPPTDAAEVMKKVLAEVDEIRERTFDQATKCLEVYEEADDLASKITDVGTQNTAQVLSGSLGRDTELYLKIAQLSLQVRVLVQTLSLVIDALKDLDLEEIRKELQAYAEPVKLLRAMNKENKTTEELVNKFWQSVTKRGVVS